MRGVGGWGGGVGKEREKGSFPFPSPTPAPPGELSRGLNNTILKLKLLR